MERVVGRLSLGYDDAQTLQAKYHWTYITKVPTKIQRAILTEIPMTPLHAITFIVALLTVIPATADVTLPNVFGNHMVLQ
ncbi:MAG: hypothetical protein CMJ78_20940 [Planctomycetaceae bacterium]|nr:hypothetical protein [Planctomycetaceae bacterium]